MPKIETLTVRTPTASDYLVGTDRSDSNQSVNYAIEDVLALGAGSGFPGTLQQVTDAGATTTNGITVSGASIFSDTLTASGTILLTGGVKDASNSLGTNGQVLTTNGTTATWQTLSRTLQQVTTAGDTTTDDITVGGITSTGTNEFQAVADFLSAIHLSGSAGTSGQILTSAGPGAPPTWETATGTFNLGAADQTLSTNRVVTGGGFNLTFTGISTFSLASTTTASLVASAFTVNGSTTLTLQSATSLRLATPNVVTGGGSAPTSGDLLRVNGTTGDCEWYTIPGTADYIPRKVAAPTLWADSTLQDDGTTAGFNITPDAAVQLSLTTTLGSTLTAENTGTGVDPTYGGRFLNTGASALIKYGLEARASGGTTGADQVGILAMAGTTSTTGTSFSNKQSGIVAIAGAINGQNAYGGQFYAKGSSTADNIGLYVEVTNAGAGTAYIGQFVDGNEGAGKVIVSDASGNANWGSVGAGGFTEEQTAGAGSGSVTTPTAALFMYRKTGITGGGDTVTLPDTSGLTTGQIIIVKDDTGGAAADNITIATFGAELIDGQATAVITADYGYFRFYWNGTSYNLI